MISRKYLKDYRIDEQIDRSGHVKSQAVYIGVAYTFSPPIPVNVKRLILCFSALSGVSFFGALVPVTNVARISYVMLPFIISVIPVYMMVRASIALLRANDAMERIEAEKITNRLPACPLIAAILAGAAFLGFIISAALSGKRFVTGDVIFGALMLVLSFASAVVFAKSRKIKIITRSTC